MNEDYEASVDVERVRLSRTLFVLLIYTALPPGRGREYREMRLKVHSGEIRELTNPQRVNVFHYSELDEKAVMYIADHKTSKKHNHQVVHCPNSVLFKRVVGQYVLRYRPRLLPDDAGNDFLFLVKWKKKKKKKNCR